MRDGTLGALQVAALLVSASYGVGFLFGSGEMALSHGMGGSLYGAATALGMALLALFAARLWRVGVPVWDMFGRSYGDGLKAVVALLSVVWMAGVLAAQIHGGVAILKLLGVPGVVCYAAVLWSILVASRMNLRLASTVFSFFLVVSSAVLLYALVMEGGIEIYLDSPRRFAGDLHTFTPVTLVSIVIAVVALVCTGADYQQFVLVAKRPSSAIWGCLLAAVFLLLISPLPAALVIGLQQSSGLSGLTDGKQVIPFALSRAANRLGTGLEIALLLGMSAAALGSGAAIVRAMASALVSAAGDMKAATPRRMAMVSVAIGGALAARGQGIVDTMVSVNMIYMGSIGVTFAALLAGWVISARRAAVAVGAGFTASFGVYLTAWAGHAGTEADLLCLVAGVAGSGVAICGPFARLCRRLLQALGRGGRSSKREATSTTC